MKSTQLQDKKPKKQGLPDEVKANITYDDEEFYCEITGFPDSLHMSTYHEDFSILTKQYIPELITGYVETLIKVDRIKKPDHHTIKAHLYLDKLAMEALSKADSTTPLLDNLKNDLIITI